MRTPDTAPPRAEAPSHAETPPRAEGRPQTDGTPRAGLDVVVFHHHPVKAPLLRGAVLPLAEALTADGLHAHVERHWLHGPHLRLRLTGPPARVHAAAEAAAVDLRAWLRRHPSRSDLTDAELLRRAEAAGRAELLPGPHGPIAADNTVRIEPADRDTARTLLGEDGTALREDLLRAGLAPLRAGAEFLGEHGDRAQARVQLAVVALAAHAAAHPAGLAGAHWSYVSHLEDFLFHEDPDGRLRERFTSQAEPLAAAVTDLVGRIVAGDARDGERVWAEYARDTWDLVRDRHAAGADLHGSPDAYRARAEATGDRGTARRWNHEERTGYSEFHHLLRRSDPQGTMFDRPDYLIHRAATNALYRLLAICDVQPLERYLAAHLVIRTVPALTGTDWHTALTRAVATVEETP
ncbi:lantibiotic dehydratase C-terminal domain-containing protein (plasmid) [Streptomyces sp. BI20]|uniref:lantibiotic dehydratase C-terminal domain-containing protein n=1 Tax=Streptomyces sp. BI20 TaxID=3403460 RepID=UPI003C742612